MGTHRPVVAVVYLRAVITRMIIVVVIVGTMVAGTIVALPGAVVAGTLVALAGAAVDGTTDGTLHRSLCGRVRGLSAAATATVLGINCRGQHSPAQQGYGDVADDWFHNFASFISFDEKILQWFKM